MKEIKMSLCVKHSSSINGSDPSSPLAKHILQCGHLVTELKFWSIEMINPPQLGVENTTCSVSNKS